MQFSEKIIHYLQSIENAYAMEVLAEKEEFEKVMEDLPLEEKIMGGYFEKNIQYEGTEFIGNDQYVSTLLRAADHSSFSAKRGSFVKLRIGEKTFDHLMIRKITNQIIEIIHDEELADDDWKGKVNLQVSVDSVTPQRVQQTFQKIYHSIENKEIPTFFKLLFDGPDKQDPLQETYEKQAILNENQKKCLEFISQGHNLLCIHGPPGTGKTKTLLSLIALLHRNQKKVLVSCGTNTAVDHIMEGLVDNDIKSVRVGHPEKVSEVLSKKTLNYMKWHTRAGEGSKECRLELEAIFKGRNKRKNAGKWLSKEEFKAEKQTIKNLQKEIRSLEKKSIIELWEDFTVFCATLSGAASYELANLAFDYVITDEAAQVLEPLNYCSLIKANAFIFAGDHCQLPATLNSLSEKTDVLKQSLFEKLIEKFPTNRILLQKQYRMPSDLIRFSNQYFYENKLEHHKDQLPNHYLTEEGNLFIDTAGADYEEKELENLGVQNEGEGHCVSEMVKELVNLGYEDIGIIAPYALQVKLLKELIHSEAVEISTVDSFQGREKNIIIISLTRSNIKNEIGFLKEIRRMNVAMTRAKEKLIIVGDSSTITNHPFYASLVEDYQLNGGYHSIYEYPQLMR